MKKVLNGLERSVNVVMIVLVATFTILVGVQVVSRYVFNSSLTWSEQAARYMFIWLIMLGMPVLYRHGEHVSFDMVQVALPGVAQRIIRIVIHILVLGFAVCWVYLSIKFCNQLNGKLMIGLGLPQVYVYAAQVAGSVLLTIFSCERAVAEIHNWITSGRKENE